MLYLLLGETSTMTESDRCRVKWKFWYQLAPADLAIYASSISTAAPSHYTSLFYNNFFFVQQVLHFSRL